VKPESYTFDLKRIFLGDMPVAFLGEVLFRTIIIYLYTLLLIRLLGKRGLGQLSPFDFVIVIALGSAVGDPMFYDDVPLLHTMLVITLVVLLQRGVSWLTERNDRVRRFIDSEPRRLVRNGVVDFANLREELLESDELFAALRVHGIRQLGQVELAYIEPSGAISVIHRKRPAAGRPLVARSDPEFPSRYPAKQPAPRTARYACDWCGECIDVRAAERFPAKCSACPSDGWLEATCALPDA
jgi:uncharacterized membrane protein YcaP (DUF421 family)